MSAGPAAPAGVTSPSSEAGPCRRAGCVYRQCGHQLLRRASGTSRHGVSVERCGAMPSCRERSLMCCYRHVRQGCRTGRHNISFERCGTMPSGRMGSPTVLPSACAMGQQHQQAYHFLRALRRHAIVPDGFRLQYCHQPVRWGCSISRHNISFELCGAIPLCQLCSLTVQPLACATDRQHLRA